MNRRSFLGGIVAASIGAKLPAKARTSEAFAGTLQRQFYERPVYGVGNRIIGWATLAGRDWNTEDSIRAGAPVALLSNGRVVEAGSPDSIYDGQYTFERSDDGEGA